MGEKVLLYYIILDVDVSFQLWHYNVPLTAFFNRQTGS